MRSVPALNDETDCSPRAKLALAIERWRAARDRVAELEGAQPRALKRRIQAGRARDEAQRRASEEEERRLVDALVADINTTETTVDDAEGATKKAEADFELARRSSDTIDRELEEARTALSWKTPQRDQAIAMIVAQSSELTELLEQHATARRCLYSIEAVLLLLNRKDALPPTARGWNSIPEWHQRDFDPALCEKWQRWLSELETDAGAVLQDTKR
jgi:chromosome segregation ATPase